jgi:hypothetical protein
MTQRRDSVFENIILNEPGDQARVEAEREDARHKRLLGIAQMMLLLTSTMLASDNDDEEFI